MAKILSFHPNAKLGEDNWLRLLWQEFNSLDTFTKLFIITYLLVVLATSYIITNYQSLNLHGQSESERLQEIIRLQEFQRNFYGLSGTAQAINPSTAPIAENISPPSDDSGFEIRSFFNWIVSFLKNTLFSPFKQSPS